MFRISFCFVVVMTFAVTSATYADLSDGLVSYWTFDDTLADQTGGNDGTYVGDTAASYAAGKFGNGVLLDGNTEHIQVNNESAFDFGAAGNGFTISVWTRVDTFDSNWQALVAKGEGSEFRLHRQNAGNNVAFNAGSGGDLGNGENVNDGLFHHIVAIHDPNGSGNNTLYVDGVAVSAARGNVVDNDQPLMIGENPDAVNREWEGLVDDLGIWGRALSDAEVGMLFSDGNGTPISEFLRNPVPEPATGLMALAGLAAFTMCRRRHA